MKKIFLLTLVFGLTFGMITGCGGRQVSEKAKNGGSASDNKADSVSENESEDNLPDDSDVEDREIDPNADIVESSSEEILRKVGVVINAPENATDVSYWIFPTSNYMAEVVFTDPDTSLELVYRIESSDSLKDISGYEYSNWIYEDTDVKIGWCDAEYRRAVEEGIGTIDVILWYDRVPGFTYSLSTVADDLDGFDIKAIAEQVYEPMQTEVDGD